MKSYFLFRSKQDKTNRVRSQFHLLIISLLLLFNCNSQQDKSVKSFDGSTIDYTVAGSGEPTLVFIQGGLGCNKHVWDHQMSYFKKKYKVVALSLAGHGKSDSIRLNYTMESYGKDVSAVVKELKLNKVILIGHSFGGIVCIEAALNLPNEVIGIIGLDCLNQFELIWEENFVKSFLDRFRTDTNKKTQDFIRQMFTEETDPMLVEKTASDFGSVNSSVFFSELQDWFNYQNEKFLFSVQRISVPITCIQNGDNVITVETNRKYNPQYKGIKMDSLGHMFLIAYPDQVNQEIESMVDYIASR